MSGEEPLFKVHYSQDKSQEQFRRQSSLITQAEFLFLIQILGVKRLWGPWSSSCRVGLYHAPKLERIRPRI